MRWSVCCGSRYLAASPALSRSALAGLDLWRLFSTMSKISYAGYRFPPEIIQQAIWLYVRFTYGQFNEKSSIF